MAKPFHVSFALRLGNVLATTLLRAGLPLRGYGNHPMSLLTVRGRKSGQPRTVVVVIIERNGKRYLCAPFGVVDWVRNLRVAEEAILTRGRRCETVSARELPKEQAALLLREEITGGTLIGRYFGVAADSSLEAFEGATVLHPVFLLERK